MFDDTLGAAFIGFAVATVFYGILMVQMYSYFQRYTLDRPLYKLLVAVVWLLETVHSVFSGHAVYHYAISSFGNPIALLIPTWSVIAQILVGVGLSHWHAGTHSHSDIIFVQACISVLVKCAFTMRVWRFSGNNVVLTGGILALSFSVLVMSVILTIQAFQLETFAEQPKIKWLTTAVLATSVFTDLVIAASLTYFLHHLRNAFSANTLINGLIAYSLETGAITSVCGIATVVSFDILPTTFVYLSFFFILSKLYSNSLLATLNTRRVVRGRGTDRTPGTNGEFTIIHSAGPVQTTHSIFGQVDWSKQPADIEVNVLKEVVSDEHRGKSVEDSPDSSYSYNRFATERHVYGRTTEYSSVADRYGVRAPERAARF
ncbi:hypothetical protein ACEPAF_9824 [Sanghuangporus sanghuang]